MANTFKPYGLARVDKVGGKDKQFTLKFPLQCNAAGTTTYPTSLAAGDPVAFGVSSAGQGQIQGLVAWSAPAAGPPIRLPTNQTPIGVFVGVKYYDLQNNLINSELWVGGTQVKAGTVPMVTVDCDPQSVYQIAVNGPISGITAGSVFGAAGLNAVFTPAGGGNPGLTAPNLNIKSSAVSLLATSIGTNTTYDNFMPFKILGLANCPTQNPTNAWTDQYPNVIGVFNNHFLKQGTYSTAV